MSLTDSLVKNTKPKEKVIRIYDTKGLYLEINPSGGKYWRVKCRINRREKRLAIGTYPELSLDEARNKRDEARHQIKNGINPIEEKRLAKAKMAEEAQKDLGLRLFLETNGDLIIKKKLTSILITKEELQSLKYFLSPISTT